MTNLNDPNISQDAGPDSARARAHDNLQLDHFVSGNEHPLLQVPFTLVMDGRTYEGTGLSLVSARAKGLVSQQMQGQRRIVALQFNFKGYALNLSIETEVVAASTETGEIELRFLNPTGPHLPQLRYLLNAVVAGDLIAVDGLIHATEGERAGGGGQTASRHNAFGARMRHAFGVALILVLSVALVGLLATGIYQRFFVLDVPGLSVVSLKGTTLRAMAPGQLDFINPSAKKGDVAFAVRTISGEVVSVEMPCDCKVVPANVEKGATLLAGDPVMHVADPGNKIVIDTMVRPGVLQALANGDRARINLPDGRTATATLDRTSSSLALPQAGDANAETKIALTPDQSVTTADLGEPVSVHVIAPPFKNLGLSKLDIPNWKDLNLPEIPFLKDVLNEKGASK